MIVVMKKSKKKARRRPKAKRLTMATLKRMYVEEIARATRAVARADQLEKFNQRLHDDIAQMHEANKFIWICNDGRRVTPAGMDEQHLRNSISYVQRRLVNQFGTVAYLEKLE